MAKIEERHAAIDRDEFRTAIHRDPRFLTEYERYVRTYGLPQLPGRSSGSPPPLDEVVEEMWARSGLTRAWERWCARGRYDAALGMWPVGGDAEARYCQVVRGRLRRLLAQVGTAAYEESIIDTFDAYLEDRDPDGGAERGVGQLVQACVADFLIVLRSQDMSSNDSAAFRLFQSL
jgi:hypothetical protein